MKAVGPLLTVALAAAFIDAKKTHEASWDAPTSMTKYVDLLHEDADAFVAALAAWASAASGQELKVDASFAVRTAGSAWTESCGDLSAHKAFDVLEQFLADPSAADTSLKAATPLEWRPNDKCVAQHDFESLDGAVHAEFTVACGAETLVHAISGGSGFAAPKSHEKYVGGAKAAVSIRDDVDISGVLSAGKRFHGKMETFRVPKHSGKVVDALHEDMRACAASGDLVVSGVAGGGWSQRYKGSHGKRVKSVVGYANSFSLTSTKEKKKHSKKDDDEDDKKSKKKSKKDDEDEDDKKDSKKKSKKDVDDDDDDDDKKKDSKKKSKKGDEDEDDKKDSKKKSKKGDEDEDDKKDSKKKSKKDDEDEDDKKDSKKKSKKDDEDEDDKKSKDSKKEDDEKDSKKSDKKSKDGEDEDDEKDSKKSKKDDEDKSTKKSKDSKEADEKESKKSGKDESKDSKKSSKQAEETDKKSTKEAAAEHEKTSKKEASTDAKSSKKSSKASEKASKDTAGPTTAAVPTTPKTNATTSRPRLHAAVAALGSFPASPINASSVNTTSVNTTLAAVPGPDDIVAPGTVRPFAAGNASIAPRNASIASPNATVWNSTDVAAIAAASLTDLSAHVSLAYYEAGLECIDRDGDSVCQAARAAAKLGNKLSTMQYESMDMSAVYGGAAPTWLSSFDAVAAAVVGAGCVTAFVALRTQQRRAGYVGLAQQDPTPAPATSWPSYV